MAKGDVGTNHSLLDIPAVAGSALLSDPHPNRYPSIPLMKLSTFLKERGYRTTYCTGKPRGEGAHDLILITTLFTFHWRDYVASANEFKRLYPGARILIGGAYASLFPEQVEKYTGIRPVIGNIPEVDECRPDLSLVIKHSTVNESHIFTTKGCPRGCEFCGSARMENNPYVIRSWKEHIHPGATFCTIHDNNILAHGDDHFADVMEHLASSKMKHMFDNGFDCRFFDRHHARLITKTRFKEIRFAFDTMDEDGFLQNAISLCKEEGIRPTKIKVFILYNFKDDLEEALYRASEVHKLGARPWAMRYTPLVWGNDTRKYIGERWTRPELALFNKYINRFGVMRSMSFEEFSISKKRPLEGSHRSNRSAQTRLIDLASGRDCQEDPDSIFNDPSLINRIIDGAEDPPTKRG